MKLISIKGHGILDYVWSVMLICCSYLVPFENEMAADILRITGFVTILYSLFTAYELGPVKLIPFRGHIALDALIGLFLIASPWLFEFSEASFLPHLVFGIVEITVVILTVRQPTTEVRNKKAP